MVSSNFYSNLNFIEIEKIRIYAQDGWKSLPTSSKTLWQLFNCSIVTSYSPFS